MLPDEQSRCRGALRQHLAEQDAGAAGFRDHHDQRPSHGKAPIEARSPRARCHPRSRGACRVRSSADRPEKRRRASSVCHGARRARSSCARTGRTPSTFPTCNSCCSISNRSGPFLRRSTGKRQAGSAYRVQRERRSGAHRVRLEQPGRNRRHHGPTDPRRDIEVVRRAGDRSEVHSVANDRLAAVQLPSSRPFAVAAAPFVAHVAHVPERQAFDATKPECRASCSALRPPRSSAPGRPTGLVVAARR